jgi:hypothetical protein
VNQITAKRKVTNQTVRKELLAQLQHLRTDAKEISRLYVANLQRDIVQLIDLVNEKPFQRTIFSQMKEQLDSINLKPEKGRRKDLRRIEDVVRSMQKVAFSNKK